LAQVGFIHQARSFGAGVRPGARPAADARVGDEQAEVAAFASVESGPGV
jgi:hypothetical protein